MLVLYRGIESNNVCISWSVGLSVFLEPYLWNSSTSSFHEDVKGINDIKDNDDDYNDKEDKNKNDTYDKDNKVDNRDYKYSSALGLDRDL